MLSSTDRAKGSTTVFVSYSRADADWLPQFRIYLKRLEREGLVHSMAQVWIDEQINSGQRWAEEIEQAIAESKVAVLLVSQVYLGSSFIMGVELPAILHAEKRGQLSVVPVLLSPCTYNDYPPLSQFQATNDPSRTLSEMRKPERQRAWIKVVQEISRCLIERQSQ